MCQILADVEKTFLIMKKVLSLDLYVMYSLMAYSCVGVMSNNDEAVRVVQK